MGPRNAHRAKDVHGMEQLNIDIKPRRADSFVYEQKDFDVTNLVKYIDKKKKEGEHITYFHAFVTAIAKCIYNRNRLNRFVQNRHIYEHNDVVISFVAKVQFNDKADEIFVMVPVKEDDNLFTISKFITSRVEEARSPKGIKKEGANKAIDVLCGLPNIIRVPIIGLMKWMDDKGCIPFGLEKDNLYYSSMIVSNLGSIKSNSIHHNIVNFGTCSGLTTMGMINNKEIIDDDGKREVRKICDWGLAFDERVADGFYFIKSMELVQYFFDHPETLEEPCSTKYDLQKK